jgi:predicted NAD/FAD-binding protein
MRVAVIGAGISGLVAAHRLAAEHEVTVFEAEDRPGGHTHTIDVDTPEGTLAIDTGFIVYNERNYPEFVKLLAELGVESQPTRMSFSVRCEHTGLEYCGSSMNAIFAQRRNLLRPGFYRMLRDILRFNEEGTAIARSRFTADEGELTVGEYLEYNGYSASFREQYLLPMAAAIWSASPQHVGEFPLSYLARFFDHHGLMQLSDRPQWRVIRGGSRQYLQPLMRRYADGFRPATPVERVSRDPRGVTVVPRDGGPEHFDQVVFACHSDQALAMLTDPTDKEREVLGAIRYQQNEAVLHTDAGLLPRRRRAWAAWNYCRPQQDARRVAVTYSMNILQSLPTDTQYLVTLNQSDRIDPACVIRRIDYAHPVYDVPSVRARRRRREISGVNRTAYCGAYWGFGFHEDGVQSAIAAVDDICGTRREHESDAELYLSRVG